jgi:predicted aldo/keto reductase-like oxidoreductase
MIQVQKERDRVFITLTSQLDREDVTQLIEDLNQWLEDTVEVPTFKGISEDKVREAFKSESRLDKVNSGLQFHNKEHKEAYEQGQSKRKLEEQLRRCFVDVLDSEYIQKELTTYQLDPINKEIITKTKKLKDERRK